MCLFLACSVYLGNRHRVRTLRKGKKNLSLVGLNSLFQLFREHRGLKGSISRHKLESPPKFSAHIY